MDLNKADSIFEKLKAHLDTEEGMASANEYFDKIERSDIRDEAYADKFNTYLETLTDKQLVKLVNRFVKWERKYGEMWYNRGIEASSNIIYVIWTMVQNFGTELEPNSDFLVELHEYRGFVMELYVGQGSFYAIRNRGKRIF